LLIELLVPLFSHSKTSRNYQAGWLVLPFNMKFHNVAVAFSAQACGIKSKRWLLIEFPLRILDWLRGGISLRRNLAGLPVSEG
jgi:hypothetical protein